MEHTFDRRRFLHTTAAGAAGVFLGSAARTSSYAGPNVIVLRFGGGARRRETIDAEHTYSPLLCHELAKRGTLYAGMEISSAEGI